MIQIRKTQIVCLIILSYFVSGCTTKEYSFTIDAPPKYYGGYILKRMQIQPFGSKKREYGINFANVLKNSIANEGYVVIVENGAECTLDGFLDIGRIYKNSNTESYKCTYYRNGKKRTKTCRTYYYNKRLLVKADFTLSKRFDKSVVYGDSVIFDFDRTWSSGKSRSDAKNSALTDEQILHRALEEIAMKITNAVTPHRETVTRELQKGSDDNIALGIKYLENGRIDQALSIWDQCVTGTDSPKDKAAGYYNIGVVKESQGLYRDAFELYSKANLLLPKEDLYIKAMTRTENLKKKEGALRKWEN